jgi:hypothetical protein
MAELYPAEWLAAPHKTATLRAVTEHHRNDLPPGRTLGKPCRKHGHTWNDTPWNLMAHGHCATCEAERIKLRDERKRTDPRSKERYRHWNQTRRSWRQQHDFSYRAYHREKSKRRKARMRGNHVVPVTASQVVKRFTEFDHACAYCGADGALHIEHFLPISVGGTHVLSNILPACHSCNYSKQAHDPETWYRAQPFFSEQRWRRILSVLGKTRSPVNQLALL